MKLARVRLLSLALITLTVACMIFSPGERALAARGEDKAADEARAEKLKKDYSDGAAVRSRLVVVRVDKDKEARPVVLLRRPVATQAIPDHNGATHHDLLVRELVRQAVLIAARDELGLVTRDEVIGDPTLDAAAQQGDAERIEVVSFIRDHQSHERIYRVAKDRVEAIYSRDTPGGGPWPDLDKVKLLEAAEAESRQDFPKVLRGLGLDGKPHAVKEGAAPELPRHVEGQLLSLGFSQTLEAVRALHRMMRTDGETPAVVGGLVRGYAQLGVLSEFLWDPSHKVFKARALLYAQRLVARDPKRPWGLWHRAFALTLVGLHRAALADLDEAKTLAGTSAKPPAWFAPIEAAARCDVRRLAGQKGPHQNLAALLRMIALEFPTTTAISLQSAREVVSLDPLCFRAHDAMCQYRGVNNLHIATEIGPQVLQGIFAVDLASLRSLPAIVQDRLAGQPGIIEMADALRKAGASDKDDGEPSWGVLDHLIRETQFVQVWRRLQFMKEWWGVPVDDYWNEVRADVAAHRYLAFLETFAVLPRESTPRFLALIDRIDLTDVEKTSHEMIKQFWDTQRPRGKAAWEMAWSHLDLTARERSFAQSTEDVKYRANASREILRVSPYNPYARATLIEFDWDKVKDDVKTWEKEAGDAPAVLGAIGWHYSALKQYDEAQRAFTRYLELSPDLWVYQKLAANFKAQGKIERWQETLDDFLNKVEDLGLDHAAVRQQLANEFMKQKQWEKAMPYAEDAAQSGAEWAMECAADCAEGLKDWERAEAWHRQISLRYNESSWPDWYYFCKRTGHGNLAAARDFVDQVIKARANRPDLVGPEAAAAFFWLDGRTEKAKELLNKSSKDHGSFLAACLLAMIADDAKDAGRRDEIIKELITKYKKGAPQVMAVFQKLLDTVLDPSGKKPLDPGALIWLIEDTKGNRDFSSFFAGWLLKNHGEADTATKLLKRASNSTNLWIGYRALAQDAVKRMTPK